MEDLLISLSPGLLSGHEVNMMYLKLIVHQSILYVAPAPLFFGANPFSWSVQGKKHSILRTVRRSTYTSLPHAIHRTF